MDLLLAKLATIPDAAVPAEKTTILSPKDTKDDEAEVHSGSKIAN